MSTMRSSCIIAFRKAASARLSFIVVAVVIGGSSATASADDAAVAPCLSTVDGHAVDTVSHVPIVGATVTATGQSPAETDGDGRFVIRNVCAGATTIDIERADYRKESRTLSLDGSNKSLSVEFEMTSVDTEIIVISAKPPPVIDMRSTKVISGQALERTRGKSLADAVAEVPGVTQLQSGSGMAKPVVRGQFGRRLQLVVNGIRHRAQEWGLDHAPEIDPFSADKISVVRGAAAVQYGPDAIGGAILVDPPALLTAPGLDGDLHLIGTSNGRGGSVAARVRSVPTLAPKFGWMIEGSAKRAASPSTPNYALNNTAVEQWNLGGTMGYKLDNADFQLSYSHYQAKLGVCTCVRVESIDDFYSQISQTQPSGSELYESSFNIDRAYQSVVHDLVVARSHIDFVGTGTLTTTYSFQHDLRREYEQVRQATTGAQFNFRLQTHEVTTAFEHRLIHLNDHWHLRGNIGATAVIQTHAYSGLPLIPDYKGYGGALYAIERLIGHETEVEAGIRYDVLSRTAQIERIDFLRLVRSGQLADDACGDSSGAKTQCASWYRTLSASLGALRQLTPAWSVKVDLSTASRPPNPDEQYLNGTSPTFPVLGLGKPNIGAETTYSASATSVLAKDHLNAEISLFANRINDYIYFSPALGPDARFRASSPVRLMPFFMVQTVALIGHQAGL
jgi:iron complex outermembrane recepter protein